MLCGFVIMHGITHDNISHHPFPFLSSLGLLFGAYISCSHSGTVLVIAMLYSLFSSLKVPFLCAQGEELPCSNGCTTEEWYT
jgi:hypothetical protein